MLEDMLGETPLMQALRTRIARIAMHDSHVLITGETGTGKEVAARAIHAMSTRREQPFVPINCAALPEALIEGELFGHERGSYTGAVQPFPGRLKLASGGSVLLDEIGEMCGSAQAKLLRVIEEREVWRVGGRGSTTLDVRFMAATNQEVEPTSGAERLRSDLYYRLCVARLHLPPLRERIEDVPLLLTHFTHECNRRFGRASRGFEPSLVGRLVRYSWPGNIRELRNFVEGTFINSDADLFGSRDLPDPWSTRIAAIPCDTEAEHRARIAAAMANAKGNKSDAARALNCSRMTLYRRLKRYDLDGELGVRLPVSRFRGGV